MKPEIILKLLKLTKSTKKSAGFTLIELLVAAIITSIIVSIAGWGLVTLMSSKKVADTQTAMQGETNRAADFINDEIRKAKFINKTDTIALLDDTDPDFARPGAGTTGNDFDPTGKSIVLALQISDAGDTNADDEMVIYYVKNNDNNWRGPKVIYRWGPAFDTNGNYSVTTNNLAYTDEPLIDSISDTVGTCTSGTLKGDTGFYTCLGGQQGTGAGAYYTSAQIYVNGLFKKPGDINAVAHYTGNSKTDTKAVSRINQNPATVPTTIALASSRVSTSRDRGRFFECNATNQWQVRITVDIGTANDYRQVIINDDDDPIVTADSTRKVQVKEKVGVAAVTTENLSSSVPLIGGSRYKIEKNGSGELIWTDTKVKDLGGGNYQWTDGRSPATASASD
ncbi:MAG: PulJ/GspJ family protein, partial [Waterburya sp.]